MGKRSNKIVKKLKIFRKNNKATTISEKVVLGSSISYNNFYYSFIGIRMFLLYMKVGSKSMPSSE